VPPSIKEIAKRAARGLVGAVSPALLRRVQVSRARAMHLAEPSQGPYRLLLEPTTGCNHRCLMCWDHSPRLAKQTPAWHMPFDRVAGLLREMAAMGTEEVWLAGRGEPLVHPKAKDILKLIGELGMRSIITTNAGVLTEELADQLCEWNLQQLSISIDSGTPATYAEVHGGPPEDRARILNLIKRISQRKEGKPRLLASMVLSQVNFREMLDLVRDAIDHGATGVVIGGMRPVPFDSTDLGLSEDDWSQVRRVGNWRRWREWIWPPTTSVPRRSRARSPGPMPTWAASSGTGSRLSTCTAGCMGAAPARTGWGRWTMRLSPRFGTHDHISCSGRCSARCRPPGLRRLGASAVTGVGISPRTSNSSASSGSSFPRVFPRPSSPPVPM